MSAVNAEVAKAAARHVRTSRPDVVPEDQRVEYRAKTTLRAHYVLWMRDERAKRIAAGSLSRSTEEKLKDALRWWEKRTRPVDWDDSLPWPGWPLNAIRHSTIQDVIDLAVAQGASPTYVRGLWFALRTVVSDARLRKVLPRMGKFMLPTGKAGTSIYDDELITTAFYSLAPQPDLQVAFVVACNAALRPIDLFGLEWLNVTLTGSLPSIEFDAEKTGKIQRIPLAPCTVAHLKRLPKTSKYVFPRLGNPDVEKPEKSPEARARTAMTKFLFAQAGIKCESPSDPFYKPWQRCRPTCNERLERHSPGVGQFVLGHSLTLNASSYREPSKQIRDAILTVPQPDCFLEILKK